MQRLNTENPPEFATALPPVVAHRGFARLLTDGRLYFSNGVSWRPVDGLDTLNGVGVVDQSVDLISNDGSIQIAANPATGQINLQANAGAIAVAGVSSIEGLTGAVDVEPLNAITVATQPGLTNGNRLQIGESHSARTDNPHAVTAAQSGAASLGVAIESVLFSTPGNFSVAVPAGTRSIVAELWGGGGAGGSAGGSSNGGGGGGGGGGYGEIVFQHTTQSAVLITVGAGGAGGFESGSGGSSTSIAHNTISVSANGGAGGGHYGSGSSPSGGIGGNSNAPVSVTGQTGGSGIGGAGATVVVAGYGGGAFCSSPALGSNLGVMVPSAGTTGANGGNGVFPGGGGQGGLKSTTSGKGGNGASGAIKLTFFK